MSKSVKKILSNIFVLLGATIALHYGLLHLIHKDMPLYVQILGAILILIIGGIFIISRSAEIIEETTEVLSEKTKLAGGLLQSLGTAFPDMILGVSAAFISLSLRNTDYERSISFAIIAAAATFGSNIYNIGHAAWCMWRQNLANSHHKNIQMFPGLPFLGQLTPMQEHNHKPVLAEFNVANQVIVALTLLTTIIALCMVVFGRIISPPGTIVGDLYALSAPVGIVVLILSILVLIRFRKTEHPGMETEIIKAEENKFRHNSIWLVWLSLLASAIAILVAADSMIQAIEVIAEVTRTPFVIAGILTGIIGCLGEMMVVHKYSINPNGRIGDAIVGVAMDNIVTITGACVVAIMGGIYLGGSSLIMIFVMILSLNTILIWQISDLKNFYLK